MKKRLKTGIICIIVVLIVVVIIIFAIYPGLIPRDYITYKEFLEDYEAYNSMGNPGHYREGEYNFKSYDGGDTIYIKDELTKVEEAYRSSYGTITHVWFESEGNEGSYINGICFDGPLADDFKSGDEVIITLHIIEDDGDELIKEWDYSSNLLSSGSITHA